MVNAETQALADPVAKWLQATGVCPDPKRAALMGVVGAFGTAYTIPSATSVSNRPDRG